MKSRRQSENKEREVVLIGHPSLDNLDDKGATSVPYARKRSSNCAKATDRRSEWTNTVSKRKNARTDHAVIRQAVQRRTPRLRASCFPYFSRVRV